MKWPEMVSYLKFPLRCSCGETIENADLAFIHARKGHNLYSCPNCGGKLKYPAVKGEYGCYDTSVYVCYSCWKEFDAVKIRTGQPVEGKRAY